MIDLKQNTYSKNQGEESLETTKIRVSFVLSPSVRSLSQRESLELPTDPIAVPASIRKRGLSAVVNHLLDRDVPGEDNDGDSSSPYDDDNDEDYRKLPAIPFDFVLNDKLLRLPLESALRKEGLSAERALQLHYFPARPPPRRDGESETFPDWITAMDCGNDSSCSGNSDSNKILFTGGADGIVRAFSSERGELNQTCSALGHASPIKCISSIFLGKKALVATGSMDQTLVSHVFGEDGSLDLHTVYSGSHVNSVGSVALCKVDGEKLMMASGDWDGNLATWSVPSLGESVEEADDDATEAAYKKRKGSTGAAKSNACVANVREAKPLQSVKAHSSNISGLAWGCGGGNDAAPKTLLTGSWDHGLKVFDIARMDCIHALNGSRVITSLSRCLNSDVVATSSPDCGVRLWDMRTNGQGSTGGGGASGMDKSLRQSHKAWVSSVRWSPKDPFILASTSHDGTLKVWDIRSSLPLHTTKAVSKKGEKALCLAFGDDIVYSGGSDCVVNQFTCKS